MRSRVGRALDNTGWIDTYSFSLGVGKVVLAQANVHLSTQDFNVAVKLAG